MLSAFNFPLHFLRAFVLTLCLFEFIRERCASEQRGAAESGAVQGLL